MELLGYICSERRRDMEEYLSEGKLTSPPPLLIFKPFNFQEREYRRTVGIICFENAFKVRICIVDVKGFVRTLQSYTPRNEGGYQRSFAQAKTRRVRAYQSYFRRSFGLLKVKGEEGKDDDEGVRDKLHSRSLINFLEEDTPLQRRPNIGGLVIASKGMIGWQWLDLLDPEVQDILLCPPLTDAEEQSKYETIMQQVISSIHPFKSI